MTNPQTEAQWHLEQIGVDAALHDRASGTQVVVGIYDTGVDLSHPDLGPNLRQDLAFSSSFGRDSGIHDGNSHGTNVAGIIGAVGNGTGVLGVAPNVGMTSIHWYDSLFSNSSRRYDAVEYGINFDVTNWSIEFERNYGGSRDINGGGFGNNVGRCLDELIDDGRDGMGTITVKAAGNPRYNGASSDVTGNAQADWMNQHMGVIVVAATAKNGEAASYSAYGSNVLISAPAASVTTDILGSEGRAGGDYTFGFGGTSAAAPVVSGVVAMILSANAELGWRDVNAILALSAAHTGSKLISNGRRAEEGPWVINGADNWNGGGMSHHLSYGYGLVDARAAVSLAEGWNLLYDQPSTSDNMITIGTKIRMNDSLAQGERSYALSVDENIRIEQIEIRIEMRHNAFDEFRAYLVSPDGTRFMLTDGDSNGEDGENDDVSGTVTFKVVAAQNMMSAGDWRVEIEEAAGRGTARLTSIDIDFLGAAANADSVHSFTDDFLMYRTHETDRRFIEDKDGGVDWLNLASVSGNIHADVLRGTLEVDGTDWATTKGFENIMTGDGDDTLFGHDGDNHLAGGRGNDVLKGGQGADRLHGGHGQDIANYFGGSGVLVDLTQNQSQYGDADGDTLTEIEDLRGSGFHDHLTGDIHKNMLIGGRGNDRLDGRGNNDVLIGGSGDDLLFGGGGDDVLSAGQGSDVLYGQEGNDRLVGSSSDELFYGGSGEDLVFAGGGTDSVFGGIDADIIDGGDGDDWVEGGAGNDTLTGGAGADSFVFLENFDIDYVKDFNAAEDELIFTSSTISDTNPNEEHVSVTRIADGTWIAHEDGSVLLLDVFLVEEQLSSLITYI